MAKIGRPTKYKPEMCAKIIEYMTLGMSLCEVSAKLGVRRETLWDWSKHKEEFSNAIKRGEGLSQAWWEGKGRINLENPKFQAALWFINMKNRFRKDWKDKHEIAHTGEDGGPIAFNVIPKFETPEAFIEWQENQQKPQPTLKLIK